MGKGLRLLGGDQPAFDQLQNRQEQSHQPAAMVRRREQRREGKWLAFAESVKNLVNVDVHWRRIINDLLRLLVQSLLHHPAKRADHVPELGLAPRVLGRVEPWRLAPGA